MTALRVQNPGGSSSRIGRRWMLWTMILVLAALGGGITYFKFFREEPPPYFASDEEHFLFGSE